MRKDNKNTIKEAPFIIFCLFAQEKVTWFIRLNLPDDNKSPVSCLLAGLEYAALFYSGAMRLIENIFLLASQVYSATGRAAKPYER